MKRCINVLHSEYTDVSENILHGVHMIFFMVMACGDEKNHLVHEVEQVSNWCDASLGKEAGTRTVIQDFAHLHGGFNLFGPAANWLENNHSLSNLLKEHSDFSPTFFEVYANQYDSMCYLPANTNQSIESSIDTFDSVVFVRLGTTDVSIPEQAETVVLDLSNADSESNLKGVLKQVLDSNITYAEQETRRFLGFPSQDDGWSHYEVENTKKSLSLSVDAGETRRLFFITPQRLIPEHARIVAGLRLKGLAGIFGYNVFAATAESSWEGIETDGIMWRSSSLYTNDQQWPDVIPADSGVTDTEEIVQAVDGIDYTTQVPSVVNREPYLNYNRDAGEPEEKLDTSDMQSALIVAYGILDWFYPYFHIVGRELDDAFVQEFENVSSLIDGDRQGFMNSMGRFMHSIYDGHGFYSDWASTDWPDGHLIVQIQQVNEEAVVRDSAHPGLNAGDTIISVDGVPADEWYEEAMSRYSATSYGYRFVLATDELKEVYGTKTLGLRDPQGNEREEVLQGQGYEAWDNVAWGGTLRESGWLEELEAGDIYYVNMGSLVTPDVSSIMNQFGDLMGASGMILDMRDYPYLDVYEFARYFKDANYSAPLFGFPTWTGAEDYELTFENWEFTPAQYVYEGPVVLMVSNKSVSAAELFSQMIYDEENVTVVGQQSASTNGTITNAWLPGQIQMTFTGMNLLNPDGTDFHGIGIVPDLEVTPTPQQFADGIDPELSAAISHIQEN